MQELYDNLPEVGEQISFKIHEEIISGTLHSYLLGMSGLPTSFYLAEHPEIRFPIERLFSHRRINMKTTGTTLLGVIMLFAGLAGILFFWPAHLASLTLVTGLLFFASVIAFIFGIMDILSFYPWRR